ncbi:MAG: hypothetical protein KA508_05945 [Gammaproteobacteria bacterium]|nr:hypothetical protein [Gammaproteobacteria bacterium]
MKKTSGSILVVSTLILSILAGLSIATMQNVVTEYQLSTHDQDKNLALASAQYALAEAKRLLLTQWAPGATPCGPPIGGCVNGSGIPVSTNGIAVWSYAAFAGSSDLAQQPGSYFLSNAQATPTVPNAKVAKAPRFFVIDLGCDPYSKANIYRIVAMGFGASVNTTAYAESQLTMPLSGQNSYTNALTTAVYGVAVTASGVPTPQIYNLASSTNSKTLFFNSVSGACSSPSQSNGTGATCERNCMNEVRVKGYSYYNTNRCTWVYGDWVSGSNQSTLTLNSNGSGGTVSLSCGPCQTAMPVPVAACASGQYNSCTGSCVVNTPPACTGGKVWNGTTCVCPASLPNLGSDGTCYAACVGVNSPITSIPLFRATAIPYWNDVQNKCGSCDRYDGSPGADLGLDKPTHLCLYHYSSNTVQVQCSNEQYEACNPANILCTKAGQVQKGYCQLKGGITCTQNGNDNQICTAWCSKDYPYCPGANYITVP